MSASWICDNSTEEVNPMPYAVAATFDQDLQAELSDLMDIFRSHGFGKTPTDYGEPPHMTLAMFKDASLDTRKIVSACESVRRQKIEMKLHVFGSFVAEENNATIYLNPVLSTELAVLHAELHKELDNLGLLNQHEYFRPGQWVPHCSLVMELSKDEYLKAVEVCMDLQKQVYQGFITNLLVAEIFPVRVLHRINLDFS